MDPKESIVMMLAFTLLVNFCSFQACCRKLYNWLKVAPYQADQQMEDDYEYDDQGGVRVLGIAYSQERWEDSLFRTISI